MDRFDYFFTSKFSNQLHRKVREEETTTNWKTIFYEKYSNGKCYAIVVGGEGSKMRHESVKRITLKEYEAI